MNFSGLQEEVHEIAENRSIAFSPKWDDLEHLWNVILEDRPQTILEFGSGYSTFVMARALQEIGAGHIFALESDPYWYLNNVTTFSMKMQPDHQIMHKSSGGGMIVFSAIESPRPLFCRYTYSPLPSADMVYVDGPSLLGSRWLLGNLEEFTVLPDVMVFDERTLQVAHVEAVYPGMYKVEKEYEGEKLMRTTMHLQAALPMRTG